MKSASGKHAQFGIVLAAVLFLASPQSAWASSTGSSRDLIGTLAAAFDGYTETQVSSADPNAMLNEYLHIHYQGKESAFPAIRTFPLVSQVLSDRNAAGLISPETAQQELLGELNRALQFAPPATSSDGQLAAKKIALAKTVVGEMVSHSELVFGFDASEQNGCAAPTSYLLILDTAKHIVFGLDLEPCHE